MDIGFGICSLNSHFHCQAYSFFFFSVVIKMRSTKIETRNKNGLKANNITPNVKNTQ